MLMKVGLRFLALILWGLSSYLILAFVALVILSDDFNTFAVLILILGFVGVFYLGIVSWRNSTKSQKTEKDKLIGTNNI